MIQLTTGLIRLQMLDMVSEVVYEDIDKCCYILNIKMWFFRFQY